MRPLNPSDVKALTALGREIPEGAILGLRTDGEHHKAALLEELADYVFDIPHFANYAGVLVKLDRVPLEILRELIIDAWLALAPKDLAAAYVAEHGSG